MNGQALAGLGFGTAGVVTDGPLTQSPHLPRIEGTNVAADRDAMRWGAR